MVLRCGRLFALANTAFTAAKHIVFEKEPEKGTCREAENEPAKNRDKNFAKYQDKKLRTNLQKSLSKNFKHICISHLLYTKWKRKLMYLLSFQSRFCPNFLQENILGELLKRQSNETAWHVR